MTDMNTFSTLTIPLGIATQLGFYMVLAIYTVFTAIFYYHWKTYGTDAKVTGLTFILYFFSTIPLLIIMGIMTLIL